MAQPESPTPQLIATYASPTNTSFHLNLPLPRLPSSLSSSPPPPSSSSSSSPTRSSIEAKTCYLAQLRQATSELQERINAELTTRMDEDKQREASTVANNNEGGDGRGDAGSAAPGRKRADRKKKKGKGGRGVPAKEEIDEVAEEEYYGEEVVPEDDD